MSHKPELPVEVVTQIEKEAIERFCVTLTHGNHVRPILMQRAAYIAGATAYASKLYTEDLTPYLKQHGIKYFEQLNASK